MARRRTMWREPAVTRGEDSPIPEKRPAVMEKIMARFEASPQGFRFDYSNGEFISSSLCIAKTFEECKAVRTLDTNSYIVHFDPATQLFWRRGGCFD